MPVLRKLQSGLAYRGLITLQRLQAVARNAYAVVDQDERALAERRAEMVLNDALAREVDAGWVVARRWKSHAVIGRLTKWWEGG